MACGEGERTFLGTFGIRPVLGRDFTAEEDRPNGPKAAILTFAFWQSRFTGGMDVLGKKISVDGVPTEIVGVLTPGFELPTLAHADLLVPQALAVTSYMPGQSSGAVRVFGRTSAISCVSLLRPNRTVPSVQLASLRDQQGEDMFGCHRWNRDTLVCGI